MARRGMVGLRFYDSGARSIYTDEEAGQDGRRHEGHEDPRPAVGPVRRDDRSARRRIPTPMPYGEVYTGLKTGIVDGADNNWPSYESSRHFEAAKFYRLTEHSLVPEVLVLFEEDLGQDCPRRTRRYSARAGEDSVRTCASCGTSASPKSRKVAEASGNPGHHRWANKQEFHRCDEAGLMPSSPTREAAELFQAHSSHK
jgi:hypothetical protein